MPTWERWKESPVMVDEVHRVEGILAACGLTEQLSTSFHVGVHALLRSAVAEQLHVGPEELGELHQIEADRGTAPSKNCRRAKGKDSVPEALERLKEAHCFFVCSVAAPHIAECWAKAGGEPLGELVYQAVPSLRCAPPAGVAIGRRHRDRDYGHQPGQVNFWLPLSRVAGDNTLYVEPFGGARQALALPLEGNFGTLHRFYGNGAFHYTKPNNTDATRVSLDFRVIPGPLYHQDWPGSKHPKTGRQAFFLGGYYDMAVAGSDGVWKRSHAHRGPTGEGHGQEGGGLEQDDHPEELLQGMSLA